MRPLADRALPEWAPVVVTAVLLPVLGAGLLVIGPFRPVDAAPVDLQGTARAVAAVGSTSPLMTGPLTTAPLAAAVAPTPAVAAVEPTAPPRAVPAGREPTARARSIRPPAGAAAPAPAPAPEPAPAPAPPEPPTARTAAGYADGLVAGVNAERSRHGLAPLRRDACADPYARAHAERMAASGTMTHQDLNAVVDDCGGGRASENVGHGAVSAQEMVRLWMASGPHRAVILDPALTTIGSGAVRRADGHWYVSNVLLGP